MQVASMSANGDGATAAGEIIRQGNRYVVTVQGEQLGPTGSIQAAAERLAHGIQARLPRNPASWGVQASCAKEGLSIAVGNLAGGGGGGGLHPCAARVLGGESLHEGLSAYRLNLSAGGLDAPGDMAGPCYQITCPWTVSTKYSDGVVEKSWGSIGTDLLPAETKTFSKTLEGQLTNEVTHVRLEIEPSSCYGCSQSRESYDSGWRKVGDPYSTGQVSLNVNSWYLDPSTGRYEYDLAVSGSGAGQYAGPCAPNSCRWTVEARHANGMDEVHRGDLPRGTWHFNTSFTGLQSIPQGGITELRATLKSMCSISAEYWCWDPPETYATTWVLVSDHMVVVW